LVIARESLHHTQKHLRRQVFGGGVIRHAVTNVAVDGIHVVPVQRGDGVWIALVRAVDEIGVLMHNFIMPYAHLLKQ
jgi:hypothetical protein